MIDVIKSLGLPASCGEIPAPTFAARRKSVINYGGKCKPAANHRAARGILALPFLHGYFKIEVEPMGVFMYGTVGMQHAAISSPSARRAPRSRLFCSVGNQMDMAKRSGRVPMVHSAQDVSDLVLAVSSSGTTR